jgi:hypothetical protein
MESLSFPSRSRESITVYEALFFLMLLLFVAVVCAWPVLAWRIHHFSTWIPDPAHTYLVHDRSGTIYMNPFLGRLYVSLPWLWGSFLALTVLTGFLTGKKPGGSK